MTAEIRVVVAAHSREVKTALFLALTGLSDVLIVAAAASTAELVSYCQTFRPDVAIVEDGLPGQPLPDVLAELVSSMEGQRLFVIDGIGTIGEIARIPGVTVFEDADRLIDALSTSESGVEP